jgi:hypothetical protein
MDTSFSNVNVYWMDDARIGSPEMNYTLEGATGAFTWRRENQVVHHELQLVTTFHVREVQHPHSIALVQRLLEFAHDRDIPLPLKESMEITTMIHVDVKAAQDQHNEGWGNYPLTGDTEDLSGLIGRIDDQLKGLVQSEQHQQ